MTCAATIAMASAETTPPRLRSSARWGQKTRIWPASVGSGTLQEGFTLTLIRRYMYTRVGLDRRAITSMGVSPLVAAPNRATKMAFCKQFYHVTPPGLEGKKIPLCSLPFPPGPTRRKAHPPSPSCKPALRPHPGPPHALPSGLKQILSVSQSDITAGCKKITSKLVVPKSILSPLLFFPQWKILGKHPSFCFHGQSSYQGYNTPLRNQKPRGLLTPLSISTRSSFPTGFFLSFFPPTTSFQPNQHLKPVSRQYRQNGQVS